MLSRQVMLDPMRSNELGSDRRRHVLYNYLYPALSLDEGVRIAESRLLAPLHLQPGKQHAQP